ncbi:unnamed protein product [Merluccius merluccius]
MLIRWRTERQDLFTGKRNAAVKGFDWNTVKRGRHYCSQEIPNTITWFQIPVSRLWAIVAVISCFNMFLIRLHSVSVV